ncbi:TatD family hydrolase [Halomonas sp. ML-15]|uniref:TatD family hydrolase n=1 Tax=Halomonas sp. ML-15 TaxID=2773305 RepID=UPI002964F979|nr:TatD family hydrolase [Halomonas sp. ML-15]
MAEPTDTFDDFLPEALQRVSPAPLVDIGANLTHASFAHDLESVLRRARAANVRELILTGTDLEHAEQAIELARNHSGHASRLYATAGVHPHDASQWNSALEADMRGLHRQPEVVAVGECGLDFNRNFSTPTDQERAFEAQLGLAVESGLPLFIHERDAGQRMLSILRAWRDDISHAVVHCFTGERETLYGYLDLDLHVGLTGWICDERRGHHLRELVGEIPANRLMLETDCPYLLPRNLPAKLKGRRHEPSLLPWIVTEIAHWRGDDEAALAIATSNTARHFFRLNALHEET